MTLSLKTAQSYIFVILEHAYNIGKKIRFKFVFSGKPLDQSCWETENIIRKDKFWCWKTISRFVFGK